MDAFAEVAKTERRVRTTKRPVAERSLQQLLARCRFAQHPQLVALLSQDAPEFQRALVDYHCALVAVLVDGRASPLGAFVTMIVVVVFVVVWCW